MSESGSLSDERLAEIRGLVPAALSSSSRSLMLCREHLEWLLELVKSLQEEMNCVLDYNLVNQELTLENQWLQEQVQELEHPCGCCLQEGCNHECRCGVEARHD